MAIKVKGEREVLAALDRIDDDARARLSTAVGDQADEIRRDEQSQVPVDTGALRAGITARQTGELTAEVAIYDPKLKYAIWIEWGRSSASPQPFATPSAELARNRWPRRAGDAVKDAV